MNEAVGILPWPLVAPGALHLLSKSEAIIKSDWPIRGQYSDWLTNQRPVLRCLGSVPRLSGVPAPGAVNIKYNNPSSAWEKPLNWKIRECQMTLPPHPSSPHFCVCLDYLSAGASIRVVNRQGPVKIIIINLYLLKIISMMSLAGNLYLHPQAPPSPACPSSWLHWTPDTQPHYNSSSSHSWFS